MSSKDVVAAGRVLVVGLGNPGSKYEGTRHNVGFEAVAAFADRFGISVTESRFRGVYGSGPALQRTVMCLLPETFMNRSGFAVQDATSFYKVAADGVIVVHDELDLPVGRIRLKRGGGHGGHNGLKSVDAQLGTRDYYRVRLGIDRPPVKGHVTPWVLGRFSAEEREVVDGMIDRAATAIERLLRDGLQEAQNAVHGA